MSLFPRDSKALNALLLGESEARHLGINVQRVKRRLIVVDGSGCWRLRSRCGAGRVCGFDHAAYYTANDWP